MNWPAQPQGGQNWQPPQNQQFQQPGPPQGQPQWGPGAGPSGPPAGGAPGGWSFDARTVAPQMGFEPVPQDWYKVIIRKSNIKPASNNPANSMLILSCEIMEGAQKGKFIEWNLNLFHTTSAQAVEIAYKTLSAICYVTGQFQVTAQQGPDNATPMLHNIPFYVFAVITQGANGPLNNIRGIKDINGNEPGKTGGGQMQQPAAPPNFGPGQPGPAQPSTMVAPGGWQGQPGPGQGQPQGQQWAPQGGQPAAPQSGGWQAGPGPGAAPQGQPQGGYQQPGPAPQGQQWGPPQGQQPAAPQGQQWQPPGQGQPAGGPPPGGAPGAPAWGRQ